MRDRVDMDRLLELVRLHRMKTKMREIARLLDMSPNTEREYREAGQRTRVEYPLTRMGRALSLPFMAMTAWSDKWLGDGTSPLTLRSRSTGQKLSVALVDERGQRARKADVELVVDARISRKR